MIQNCFHYKIFLQYSFPTLKLLYDKRLRFMKSTQKLAQVMTENMLRSLRMKEVLIFLVGYSFGELNKFLQTLYIDDKTTEQQPEQIISSLYVQINKSSRYTKVNLVEVFSLALQNFYILLDSEIRAHVGKIIFFELVRKGIKFQLQINSMYSDLEDYFLIQRNKIKQDFVNNENLKKKMRNNEKTENTIIDQSSMQVQQAYQSDSLQQTCQICFQAIKKQKFNSYNSKIPSQNINKQHFHTEIIEIQTCYHRFHKKCIIEQLKFSMRQAPNLIKISRQKIKGKEISYKPENSNYRQKPIDNQVEQKTFIKCPQYLICQNYLSLKQIHQIILEYNKVSQEQNLLEIFYDIIFRNYLIEHKIVSFRSIKKHLLQTQRICSKKQQKTQNIKEHQHRTPEILYFWCDTPDCNAVYEIQLLSLSIFEQQKQLTSHLSLSPSNRSKSTLINNKGRRCLLQNFICMSCQKPYCVMCFSPLHPEMTCKQYAISTNYLKQDQQFQKYLTTLKKPYKKCPRCKFFVDNWRGCSTVKCRCGQQFCYKCGGIGCPHAKCLKEMNKQQLLKLQQTKLQQGTSTRGNIQT